MYNNDLHCVVCQEPWDAHGVKRDGTGDMKAWEADLFLKGVGCPCCQGRVPAGIDQDKAFEKFGSSLLTRGYDDFGHHDSIIDGELDVSRKLKWEEPEPEVIWQCHGCGIKIVRSIDCPKDWEFRLDRDFPFDRAYQNQYRIQRETQYRAGTDVIGFSVYEYDEPESIEIGGETYCAGCITHCDHCLVALIEDTYGMEIYDEGYSIYNQDSRKVFCMECWEETCVDCGEHYEACTAIACETCGKVYHDEWEDCECPLCDECGEKPHNCECEKEQE